MSIRVYLDNDIYSLLYMISSMRSTMPSRTKSCKSRNSFPFVKAMMGCRFMIWYDVSGEGSSR